MLRLAARSLVGARTVRPALSAALPARSFVNTPRSEADGMGSLIDKGKNGAEYVVSGKYQDREKGQGGGGGGAYVRPPWG